MQLFVDGSGSMAGYLTNRPPSTYRDVLNLLPGSLRNAATTVKVRRFAAVVERPQDLSDRFAADILEPDFYRTRDNGNTHLHDVLREAATQPDVTSIIVTDLVLSARELQPGDAGPLRKALSDVLHAGSTIALVGVESSFSGRLYDLATVAGPVPFSDGNRPFYLLLIGPDARVRFLYATLRTEVLDGLPQGSHHLAVFASRPVPKGDWGRSVELSGGAAEARLLGRSVTGEVTQVRIGRDRGSVEMMMRAPDDSQAWLSGQVLAPDPHRALVRSKVYFHTGDGQSCEAGWLADDEKPNLVRPVEGKADRLTFKLFDNAPVSYGFRPRTTYALDAVATVPILRSVLDETHWVRRWSYDAAQERNLLQLIQDRENERNAHRNVRQPRTQPGGQSAEQTYTVHPLMFPTLNLASLSDLMIRVIKEKHEGERVHAFRLVFTVD
ncbi:hypothetical protein D2T81_19130 [Azospirillum brasilense]|nr:hypothetical protein D2T81_19130 [Azospirillum brasilense]